MTRRALFLTAMDRPDYLRRSLNSWLAVPELHRWHVVFRVEPSPVTSTVVAMIKDFASEYGLKNFRLVINPERYGVLHHPWMGFEDLFGDHDFVVRTEDDLIVSNDVLRYFEWADERFARDRRIGTVNAFNGELGDPADAGAVEVTDGFNPWVWGTWRRQWEQIIGPTWDHDYSTGGHGQQGWDWNITLRVFPQYGLHIVRPRLSRVKNIGEWGVHGKPENLPRSPTFVQVREPVEFDLTEPEQARTG